MTKPEFATLTFVRYRDKSGLPVCSLDVETGEVCEFFGVRRFALQGVCMLGENRDIHHDGSGYVRPDEKCKIWS